MEYIKFGFDRQVIAHEVDVDFNDQRVKQHLRALVRGIGSTTEGILNDFVKGTYISIKDYESVQNAWERLDKGQQEYVFAFRNLMNKPFLGDRLNFPHHFYCKLVSTKYMDLYEAYERGHGEDSLNINVMKNLVMEAEALIRKDIISDVATRPWSVEEDETD